jgi:dihydroceramidase
MQLADELPMIYTVCIMAFATFSYKRPAKVQVLIALGLIALSAFITVCGNHAMRLPTCQLTSMPQVYYLYAQDPVFHQVAYGILTLGTISRGFYVMERDLRPKLSQRNPAECDQYMREMYKLAVAGLYHIPERPGVPSTYMFH